MKRIDCLKAIAGKVGDALVVGTAGGATVEWYHLHPSEGNFRSRTLGLASSIGLGIALGLPGRKVIVLDGDGSLLMNLCGLPTMAWAAPRNLIHVVFDNGVYEFVGIEFRPRPQRTPIWSRSPRPPVIRARFGRPTSHTSPRPSPMRSRAMNSR